MVRVVLWRFPCRGRWHVVMVTAALPQACRQGLRAASKSAARRTQDKEHRAALSTLWIQNAIQS